MASKEVLIIEDDPKFRTLVKLQLKVDGYSFIEADSVERGLEICKERPSLRVVLLDLEFPDGNGKSFLEGLGSNLSKYRIIVLTAHEEYLAAKLAGDFEIFRYLPKPARIMESLRFTVSQAFKDIEREQLDALAILHGITPAISDLIAKGESETLEFKTSARWDIRNNKINKELEKVIIKTVASFLNSEKGGRLLIGVDDNGNVVGLEADYQTLQRKDLDGYENYLTNLLLGALGKDLSLSLAITFHKTGNEQICEILARPAPRAVFVSDDKGEHLFVRTGNSTRALSAREAIEYSKVRWKV